MSLILRVYLLITKDRVENNFPISGFTCTCGTRQVNAVVISFMVLRVTSFKGGHDASLGRAHFQSVAGDLVSGGSAEGGHLIYLLHRYPY